MRKFFVENENIVEEKIFITGQDVNHIRNVLRLDVLEKILVCDKSNFRNYICEIIEIKQDEIECKIIEEVKGEAEGNVELHIFQGLPKADKMELIIQKGTELGISSYIPVKLSRCIVKLDGKDEVKKIDRWNKISEVAAKQSGRDRVPLVHNLKNIKEVSQMIDEYDLFLVAYEEEKENTLKSVLKNFKGKEKLRIAVIIGPEGGIDESEINLSKDNKFVSVTLGKRILRTETAPLVIASNIIYDVED